jgi:hypothetical protein
VYVRLADDPSWHYLGHTTEFGIEIVSETRRNWGGQTISSSDTYYIEIKP